MLLFRTICRAREALQTTKGGEDLPRPLLEHLEELRRTILRMGGLLLAAMLLCFFFTPQMMQVLRYPVQRVWETHEAAHLPKHISTVQWTQAKELAQLRAGTPPKAWETLSLNFDALTCDLADIVPLLKAAALLPPDQQSHYLSQTCTPTQLTLAEQLREHGAELRLADGRESLKLMGAFQPAEAFMLSLNLAFFGGLIITFPFQLYFLIAFIAPGLLERERRVLYQAVIYGCLLFLAGCSFAYFAVLPRVLTFFYNYATDMGIQNDWRIGYYLSFAAKLVFMFGAVFEIPALILPLIKLGILSYDLMKRTRSYALIFCFAAALLLAPAPDPGTMLLMAMPMYLLYELCILFAWRQRHTCAGKE